ncbi:hypothetical protein GIB67_042193 [Kingdonia uniflora]|uniref:DOMON domain-containing protein n=1 Tax=Kingdonia uniflora TaxID=39325 RepID=A0A7J7LE14_9MAGN|nr:hypothetical protein GIB67_042193 [Kingdonia uniflora]
MRFIALFYVVDQNNLWGVVALDEEVQEELDRCNARVTNLLPALYNNVSRMVCALVWNSFTLRFSQGLDHVMTIILSAVYTTGWVGIGFSKEGMMVGASAMVGWITKEGHANIKQYYIQGFTPSEVIPDKGELSLTKVPHAIVLRGTTIYMTFQLKFSSYVNKQPILLAFGTREPVHNRLTEHDDKTSIIFEFSEVVRSNNSTILTSKLAICLVILRRTLNPSSVVRTEPVRVFMKLYQLESLANITSSNLRRDYDNFLEEEKFQFIDVSAFIDPTWEDFEARYASQAIRKLHQLQVIFRARRLLGFGLRRSCENTIATSIGTSAEYGKFRGRIRGTKLKAYEIVDFDMQDEFDDFECVTKVARASSGARPV